MLPRALSGSQTASSEESQRLEEALEGIDEGKTPTGEEARSALAAASQSQKAAAESASKGDASQAASSAREAESQLAAAKAALERARAEKSGSSKADPKAQALAQEQEALAKSLDELSKQAGESSLPEAARESTRDALSAAKASMQSASQSMSKGSNSAAAGEQREAVSELQKAAGEARQSPELSKPADKEEARALAEEQERIRKEVLELAKRNQKRETAKPTPSLSQAAESAGRAKESLDEGDLSEAQESEAQTEREMREAMRELSEEEEEYQKLRAEELLFKVAEQVKAILEGHREQMKATLEIDGARKADQPATHTQRLRLRKVSKAEGALGQRSAEIGTAIRAEQSLVFAEVLDESARDLERLARDLGEDGGYQSGERVQGLQQDVEQGLAWLHEALQAEKERRRQEPQGGGGQPNDQQGQNRLVPDAAELKLLRSLEVENLQALERFKILHPEVLAGQEVDPLILEDIGRLAHRHQRTSDLFEQFRKRLGLPDPPAQDP